MTSELYLGPAWLAGPDRLPPWAVGGRAARGGCWTRHLLRALGIFFAFGLVFGSEILAAEDAGVGAAAGAAGGQVPPLVMTLQPGAQSNQWRLAWPTQPGERYVLQKSADLVVWAESAEISATAGSVVQVDTALPGQSRTFWRVFHLGGALEPISVSPVVASYQLGAGESKALLRLTTAGSQIVSSVRLFDQGVLLGNAAQGFGGSWTFNVVWDGQAPRTQNITARATTEDGLVFDTPVQTFLLADPARFVPLATDGTPRHGEFVPVDATGRLGPFRFYPEGTGDAALRTGAYFSFGAGAGLVGANGTVQIEFSSGRFFRGPLDPAPLTAAPGTRRLNIDDVTPAGVTAALGLGSGSGVDLLWGPIPLRWVDGALAATGWSGMRVRPLLGDFVLPGGHECTRVLFDPKTGSPSLVLCFYGDWAPFSPAATPHFRVPRGEPLKIRLTAEGAIDAEGTLELQLADGASVRGSVVWRKPNFEARFEGRNFVIPAFASLQRALPANPELCLPSSTTPSSADLDAATRCLISFRDVYRGLAMGGLAEAPLVSPGASTSPLAEAVDPVGTALHAWAARLGSWMVDRPGQSLDEAMRTELANLIGNAARAGESANELPTVLKLLRDVLALRTQRSAGVGGAAAALDAALAEAEGRLLAATERLALAKAAVEPSDELHDVVSLLAEAGAGVTAAGGGGGGGDAAGGSGGGTPRDRLQSVLRALKDKLGLDFLARRAIQAGDLNGNDNFVLRGLDSAGVLGFMEELVQCFELLQKNGLADTAEHPPLGVPLWEAVRQARDNFVRVHNAQCAAALASRDYLQLRAAVADRARYFDLNARLGVPLPSDDNKFERSTRGLLDVFADALEALPNRTRSQYCGADFLAVDSLVSSTTDRGTNSASLDRALALVTSCSDLLVASSGTERRCDDVLQAMLAAGLPVAPREVIAEGASFPDVSGRYELALDGAESYVTLQLNQGGRYFKGRMQVQEMRANGSTGRYYSRNIEGWFLRQLQAGLMEIGARSFDPATGQASILRGTTRREPTGLTTIVLNGQTFAPVTDRPVQAESVIQSFEKQHRDVVRAANENPMHHRLVTRIATSAAAARLIIERYYGDAAGPTQEQAEVSNLNALLSDISRMVDPSQRAMARLIVRQVLSARTASVLKSKVTRVEIVGGRINRSHWELALGMALEYPVRLDQAADMLGFSPAGLRSAEQYHYTVTVKQVAFPLKAVFGASELDVTVRKRPPPGSNEPESTFNYDGFLVGAGLGAGAGVTISDTTQELDSPFSYGPADFEGEIRYIQAGAGVAWADIGVSAALGVMEIVGSGRFPTIVVNLTSISGQAGLSAQLTAIEVGGGMMVAEGSNREPGQAVFGDVLRFDAEASGRFDQAVYFDVDSDVVSPCGLQFLREFVAEYRALFEAPKSFVEIRGMTDRTASAAYNLDLSQRRANRVRDALVGLVGPDLAILPENISAIGLGEGPATDAGVPDAPSPAADNPAFRRVEVVVGGRIVATIPTPAGRRP